MVSHSFNTRTHSIHATYIHVQAALAHQLYLFTELHIEISSGMHTLGVTQDKPVINTLTINRI